MQNRRCGYGALITPALQVAMHVRGVGERYLRIFTVSGPKVRCFLIQRLSGQHVLDNDKGDVDADDGSYAD